MGVFVQTRIFYWTGALRIKARDIVMAGLNARGLQSKLLITPLSGEAIIMKKALKCKPSAQFD